MFAALKGLNMIAQGNALGTENGHESKPCKGEIEKFGGSAMGRDLLHALYAALSWQESRLSRQGNAPSTGDRLENANRRHPCLHAHTQSGLHPPLQAAEESDTDSHCAWYMKRGQVSGRRARKPRIPPQSG